MCFVVQVNEADNKVPTSEIKDLYTTLTDSPTNPPEKKHEHPTPDAKTLRTDIQTLENTIATKKRGKQ